MLFVESFHSRQDRVTVPFTFCTLTAQSFNINTSTLYCIPIDVEFVFQKLFNPKNNLHTFGGEK